MKKISLKPAANDGYQWDFCSLGGVTRVSIKNGQDLAHLDQLDEKLWTVLSLPVGGLEFDAKTLSLLDTDSDGKIRIDEVKAASRWLCAVLNNPDDLLKGEDYLLLDSLNETTPEGKAAKEAALKVLAKNDDKSVLTLNALTLCSDAFQAKCQAAAEAAAAKAAAETSPYGDATDTVMAAANTLKAKVADFFVRCQLIAFQPESADSLDVRLAKIGELGGEDLSACQDRIASMPLAKPNAKGKLPLTGINPAWQGAMNDMKAAFDLDFPKDDDLDQAQWNSVLAKLDAYAAAKQACLTQGSDQLKAEEADMLSAIDQTAKLIYLYRDFYRLMQNYVIMGDLYHKEHQAIFQAGRLFVDQRCCDLCLRVSDMGKHGDMAAQSGMFLLYCTCTAKSGGAKMDIVAVLTDGDVNGLIAGKNGIFYDRNGQDWDAVITKVVDNPISIKQAFWSPYRKFGNWCTTQINKLASQSESKVTEQMTAGADKATTEASAKIQAGEKAPNAQAFDIAKFCGIFAAIGMAIGYIGGFLLSLAKGFVGLGWYMPLGLLAVVLVISGPSMFIAWSKLRRRDLGPVLNANGWAINARILVNVRFGATLTSLANYPVIVVDDPFGEKKTPAWKKWFWSVLVVLVVAFGALFFTNTLSCIGLPFHKDKAATEQVEAAETTESPVEEAVTAE